MRKWFENTKRAYLLDFQMPDSADQMPIGQPRNLRHVNPEKIVEQLHRAGVQALYVHAKDNQGNCYYNTRFGHKHSGIGNSDLMRDFSEACRKVGMSVLYYVQLSRERRGNLAGDYAARDENGSPVIRMNAGLLTPAKDESPVMCLNGPGREYIKNIVRELAENYDFDGYWLDCFSWWGRVLPCYCEACRVKYREDTGKELPGKLESWSGDPLRGYLIYRRRQNTMILHEIISTIRAVNAELTVAYNGAGSDYAFWSNWELCDRSDYVSMEFHYNEGYGNLALWCRKEDALSPDQAFELEVWRFFNLLGNDHMVRGYQVKPTPLLLTEMSTIVANGGFVQYYDQIRPDGTLDPVSIGRVHTVFNCLKEIEPWLPDIKAGHQRVKYVDIVWSKQTECFANRRGDINLAQTAASAHNLALEGIHDAFLERRLLHSVISERTVAQGDIRAHVLVCPNLECMSKEVADGLRRFVAAGGGLVATYRTSLADELGRFRGNFLLADLFGCDYLEPLSFTYSFMQFDCAGLLTNGLELGWPMTVWHKLQLKVSLRSKAQGHGVIVNPMRGMMMGHPPQETTPFPAAVTNWYGAGRVVYFPQPLGQAYHDYGHPDFRTLLENAVRWAAGEEPPIELNCPETIEVVLWENKGVRYLHLINRTPGGPVRTKASVITEEIPVYNLEILTRFSVRKAILQPTGEELRVKVEKDGARIIVPRVNIHNIVELQ